MHMLGRLHWTVMHDLRHKLHWLPDLCTHRMYKREQLQRPCCERERQLGERMQLHLCHWFHWISVQCMRCRLL